ncbi:hypothetical protein ES703_94805 [subsurface metagenome]
MLLFYLNMRKNPVRIMFTLVSEMIAKTYYPLMNSFPNGMVVSYMLQGGATTRAHIVQYGS